MTVDTIKSILKNHYIEYDMINNRIVAKDYYLKDGKMYFDNVDVTDYKKRQLYEWLGY